MLLACVRCASQVAVLTAGERLLLTMAKLAVACACTGGAAIAMSGQAGAFTALDNANGALFFTFVATFCVADAWMSVYDSAAEAIFLCYLVDQEENDGDTRPYYATPTLRKYMERHRPSYRLPALTPEGSRDDEPPLEQIERMEAVAAVEAQAPRGAPRSKSPPPPRAERKSA